MIPPEIINLCLYVFSSYEAAEHAGEGSRKQCWHKIARLRARSPLRTMSPLQCHFVYERRYCKIFHAPRQTLFWHCEHPDDALFIELVRALRSLHQGDLERASTAASNPELLEEARTQLMAIADCRRLFPNLYGLPRQPEEQIERILRIEHVEAVRNAAARALDLVPLPARQPWWADILREELLHGNPLARFLGNTECAFNARSHQLRCAVNPSGPCEGCSHFEPR